MNITEPLNRSFLEFEQMMKEQHVFRNPSRDPIGKGKKGGKAECQGKAECPGKGNVGKGKGKARDKNQIVRTYYAPAEDTRQARGCAMTNIKKTKSKFKWHGMAVLIIFKPLCDNVSLQIRRLFFKEDEGLGWWAQPGADEVNIPDGTGHWSLRSEPELAFARYGWWPKHITMSLGSIHAGVEFR